MPTLCQHFHMAMFFAVIVPPVCLDLVRFGCFVLLKKNIAALLTAHL